MPFPSTPYVEKIKHVPGKNMFFGNCSVRHRKELISISVWELLISLYIVMIMKHTAIDVIQIAIVIFCIPVGFVLVYHMTYFFHMFSTGEPMGSRIRNGFSRNSYKVLKRVRFPMSPQT